MNAAELARFAPLRALVVRLATAARVPVGQVAADLAGGISARLVVGWLLAAERRGLEAGTGARFYRAGLATRGAASHAADTEAVGCLREAGGDALSFRAWRALASPLAAADLDGGESEADRPADIPPAIWRELFAAELAAKVEEAGTA